MSIGMVASGGIDLKSYITHEILLIKAHKAFEIASNSIKSGALKVVLKP
jgi:threonine dehydrogenase-like Zn-dependent dehydrogenase